jgi:predicted DNA-binding transcriptional regulator AlpA
MTPGDRRCAIDEAEEISHLERTSIWRRCKAGTFPAPRYLGARRFWWRSELEQWLRSEMEKASRTPPPPSAVALAAAAAKRAADRTAADRTHTP